MNKLIFKRIDLWLQITAFLSFALFIIINSFEKSAQFYYPSLELILPYLVSYFLIIIIQFFSFFLNILEFKIQSKSRTKWQIIFFILSFLLIVLVFLYYLFLQIGFASFLFYQISNFLFFLVLAVFVLSPILVVWYLIITWTELTELEKEPVILSKTKT